MKKAIVTGANGFVGTALCRELSQQGVNITAVIRDESENIESIRELPNLSIVYCDLSEFNTLPERIGEKGFDVLYHLAWVGSAGLMRGDADVQIKNIQYACDTAGVCSELECKKMVFACSIMEYEIAALMETDLTPSANTLYCSAKVAADYMARTVAGSVGVEYIRAVISNVYGPGEMSPRLINTSLRKMINGEYCSFSSGEQMYDFIYITDAAKTFVKIGEYGIPNRTYYIGSLNPRPLKEFLKEMRDCVDPNITIGLGDIPFSGVSLTYKEFDINAVKNDTGFMPEVSFKEGINKTIDWLKER